MNGSIRVTLVLVVLSSMSSTARATVLFDAAVGSTPDAQGWVFLTNPLFGQQSTQSVAGGALTLDTRSVISEQAGYFSKVPLLAFEHPNHPTMDLSAEPFRIGFEMRQIGGSDVADTDPLAAGERNRGGFSVIAISENLAGIELQFQTDNILALDDANAAFPIGESQPFDTADALHAYELELTESGYQLFADDALILQGNLRDYSGIAPPAPSDFPYVTPSFFFFGDNTGRGEARTELTRFEVAAVPEPSAVWMLMIGIGSICLRRKRLRLASVS